MNLRNISFWIVVLFAGIVLTGCTQNSLTGIRGAYDHPAVGDRLIYVSGIDGYLYAIDKTTGLFNETGWRRPQDPPEGPLEDMPALVSGPAFDRESNIVVVGSDDGRLYAYDASTGEPRWSFETGDKIWSTPVIHRGTVYFGSHDRNIYAVSARDGLLEWSYKTGGIVAGKPLIFRDMVVAGSFDKKLYAIDADGGSLRWELEGDHWFWAGAVANDRTIFAPSMDGNIYAIDRGGKLLWKYDVGAPIVSRPSLMLGSLVVAGKNGTVVLLDTGGTGADADRLIDSEFVGDAEIRAPLFVEGRTLYVGTLESTVVRLDLKGSTTSRLDLSEAWCYNTETGAKC